MKLSILNSAINTLNSGISRITIGRPFNIDSIARKNTPIEIKIALVLLIIKENTILIIKDPI